jgi:hypothetical protein
VAYLAILLIVEDVDNLSLQKKYQMLCDDTESDTVVLHCHGGGMMYCLSFKS